MVQQKSVFKEEAWTSWDEIMSWGEGGNKVGKNDNSKMQ